MGEIIPTIIAQDIAEVERRIRMVESYVLWVQLDIMDGRFVEVKTWNRPEELSTIKTTLHFEADLMVQDPVRAITPWIESRAERIFVQREVFENEDDIYRVAERVHAKKKEFGLTLNVETPVERIFPFAGIIDRALFRGGTPGSYGRPFQEVVFEKIRAFREHAPDIPIAIDGGVRLDLVKRLREAGVVSFSVGSAIFNAPDIQQAIEALKEAAE